MISDAATRANFGTPSSADTFSLEQLVKFVMEGRIRVPHFQRDFRWELRDVRRLFDSIVRAYPIGSLLLWRRPAPAALLQELCSRIRPGEKSQSVQQLLEEVTTSGLEHPLSELTRIRTTTASTRIVCAACGTMVPDL